MEKTTIRTRIQRLTDRAIAMWEYCSHGVWSDTRRKFSVNFIKTLNITVKSFLNTDLQSQACAMTYRTLLAIVPALALLFAIGRGFGFQALLQDELYQLFPSQKQAVDTALSFVDSYLNTASEGIFVGVGIVFLLYTIINLVSNVESTFNLIWNVRTGRSFWRKITDYTAMLLILPILMICGAGFTMFLSTSLQHALHLSFMTPVITVLFEIGKYLSTCLFFTGVFMLVPNTKVKFNNALLAGTLTGLGFILLQWLFISGQLYVSRYNAIYGSFAFLPLLLIWMQLVWVICLSGALICYASQNIFQYSFTDQINSISRDYNEKVTIAISAIIVQRFERQMPPVTIDELITKYGIPPRLVATNINRLSDAGLVSMVVVDKSHQTYGYQPAVDPKLMTLNYLRVKLNKIGDRNFIPNFDANFPGVVKTIDNINHTLVNETQDIALSDIQINLNPQDGQ